MKFTSVKGESQQRFAKKPMDILFQCSHKTRNLWGGQSFRSILTFNWSLIYWLCKRWNSKSTLVKFDRRNTEIKTVKISLYIPASVLMFLRAFCLRWPHCKNEDYRFVQAIYLQLLFSIALNLLTWHCSLKQSLLYHLSYFDKMIFILFAPGLFAHKCCELY